MQRCFFCKKPDLNLQKLDRNGRKVVKAQYNDFRDDDVFCPICLRHVKHVVKKIMEKQNERKMQQKKKDQPPSLTDISSVNTASSRNSTDDSIDRLIQKTPYYKRQRIPGQNASSNSSTSSSEPIIQLRKKLNTPTTQESSASLVEVYILDDNVSEEVIVPVENVSEEAIIPAEDKKQRSSIRHYDTSSEEEILPDLRPETQTIIRQDNVSEQAIIPAEDSRHRSTVREYDTSSEEEILPDSIPETQPIIRRRKRRVVFPPEANIPIFNTSHITGG